jgi:hypothetical protein
MKIEEKLNGLKDEDIRRELSTFLSAVTNPAFGAMPKKEIELAIFQMLRDLDLIKKEASIYSLMTDLRITRAKSSQLLFDLEVRRFGQNSEKLDQAVLDALSKTRFAKDGDFFIIEVENPLILAHFRQKIRELGHISDTSFNSSIVRAPLDAITDLMLAAIPKSKHAAIRKALVKAGAPDKSMKGVLKSSLKILGSKVLGDAAGHVSEGLVDGASKWLEPLFEGSEDAIKNVWKELFPEKTEEV